MILKHTLVLPVTGIACLKGDSMHQPRILITAGASGSGKTLITCGILQALRERGLKVSSFKSGPDYIDPMFHSKVIKAKSANLDLFFTNPEVTRYLFTRTAQDTDISVMEGVMGFYDGLGGTSVTASTYELAAATDTPAVMVVNCRGMSISVLAQIKGFVEYKPDSHLKGVILNQMSPMLYPRIKAAIEEEIGVKVYGYVPKITDCLIESRHLGLVLPDEVKDLEEKLRNLALVLEETLDIDGLIELAGTAPSISGNPPEFEKVAGNPVIAVASDEAFCFIYQDNIRILEEMGAKLVYFSPLTDAKIPEGADGLLLYGGYPELFAKKLHQNKIMRQDIKEKLESGLPCMAECGGFLYLHEQMEDMEGNTYEMAGVISGRAYRTEKLGRFGYIDLIPRKDQLLGMDIGTIKAHEFHYFDSTNTGSSFQARKPAGKREWECICGSGQLIAGFPHLYYYSNPAVPYRFLKQCVSYRELRSESGGREGCYHPY